MAKLCRVIAFVFWVLGLLTTLTLVVTRLTLPLRRMLEERVELRSLLWLAGLFFLGSIATWAIERGCKEQSAAHP